MINYRNIQYLIFIIFLLVFLNGCSEKDDIYLCRAEVSPKADKIAVSYVKSGKSGIFILDLQSKKRTNLLEIESEYPPSSLSWSPDQTKICYMRTLLVSDGATGELGLYLICVFSLKDKRVFSLTDKRFFSLKDNRESILTHEGMNYAPKWSPAGGFIAFASRRENMTWLSKQDFWHENLWVVNDKTFRPFKPLTTESNLQHFFAWCWSDDGRYIFYCRRTEKYGNGELCIINPMTLEEKVLSSGHWINSSCWSPDGTRIFFYDRNSPRNAYILFLDSDVIRPIFEIGNDNSIAQPKWSPDGRKIAFYKLDENKRWDIWSVDNDGNNPGKIINLSIPVKKGGFRFILGWLTNNELIFNRDKKALYSHNISTGLERQIYP